MYAAPPGDPGSLLADLVLEGAFGWTSASTDMETLSREGLLQTDLVSAMDQPPEQYAEHAFPKHQRPYKHQIDCWEHLLGQTPLSVLVASGTGSGKTECFLVPILEDLARERAKSGPLTGVRALFLYPLNALINSQRNRLRAWCSGFGSDIRFCLYNGETPESVPSHEEARAGAEQLSREKLRASPAPLLITNPTMLEYMLVRAEDSPIVAQSSGLLRWVVLDEAHTYMGSQAAEMALLLRRVMHRFGVNPSQVRFVATSATIGAGGSKSKDALCRFLADVSGAPADRVRVITAKRYVPPLPAVSKPTKPSNMDALAEQERYDVLCNHPTARAIRAKLAAEEATELRSLCKTTGLSNTSATELLEQCATARKHEHAFLPLRVHFFHRGQSGLWACVNRTCEGRANGLSEDGWSFGSVFTERRTRCNHCGFPVYSLSACIDCGQEYLLGKETIQDGVSRLESVLEVPDADEFTLDIEQQEGDQEESFPFPVGRRLICGSLSDGDAVETLRLDAEQVLNEGSSGIPVHLVQLTEEPTACLQCGSKRGSRQFRELRIGAPFALASLAPVILAHTPPMPVSGNLPSGGRRLLGFTDSRQGSARLAVRLQQEAERNLVRSILFHGLADKRTTPDTRELEEQVNQLSRHRNPVLETILKDKERELSEIRQAATVGVLTWHDAQKYLASDQSIRLMHSAFRKLAGHRISELEYADFCLYREFFRRPKRMNSAETMGLVSLRYRELENKEAPPGWPLEGQDWANFLKLMVDFLLRDASAVDVDNTYLYWMGIKARKSYIQGPGFEGNLARRQRRWPSWRGSRNSSRLPRLLQRAANLDDSPASADRINEALLWAWNAMRPHMRQSQDGYLLKLSEIATLSEPSDAVVCPFTSRVLDTTLKGLSPYSPRSNEPRQCEPFVPPQLPQAYWRDPSGKTANPEEIRDWLENDANVRKARTLGVWSSLNDRIAANAPYYETAEHSAQLDGPRLRQLEQRFKDGQLNILSCSTTMELGVDIGGLSAVIMTNAPPSAANYRQRAGRAGRRGEGVSMAFTLCGSNAHGEQVFGNPLWAFTADAAPPRVALDSSRLVQRHVNALCLGYFLEGQDIRRLKAGLFFQAKDCGQSLGTKFSQWCKADARNDRTLTRGIRQLVQGTALAKQSAPELLGAAADSMDRASAGWEQEADALKAQFREFSNGKNRSPAILAIERQLKRLEDEYLLRELANRQFLPGYGFPSGIVSFNNTTIEALKRRRDRGNSLGREEMRPARLGFPSRQLEIAIREYAPGSEITIDGRVYRSSGITLNWHIPPGVDHVSEVQALRNVWWCKSCGANGDQHSLKDECTQCGSSVKSSKYLEPAGFAVDIRHEPHNNVTNPAYVPFEHPFVSCPDKQWSELTDPVKGRLRYAPDGHLFHLSTGQNGHGYAICLRCGRAASETGPRNEAGLPDEVGPGHTRLRGGKDDDGQASCDGAAFAIQRHLWLGGGRQTDVCEIQLVGMADNPTALSLAIAMRRAFCGLLGIEDEEVGFAARPSKAEDGSGMQSLFLYDSATGGNGYVAALKYLTADVLHKSLHVLDCRRNCDQACHGCLLSYSTQHYAKELSRHHALSFLNRAMTAERMTKKT